MEPSRGDAASGPVPRTVLSVVMLSCFAACSSDAGPLGSLEEAPDHEMVGDMEPVGTGAPLPPAPTDSPLPIEQEAPGGFTPTLPALQPGEPVDSPPGLWTWVEVPEARCMGDQPTGMHFNMGDPEKLVILMEGGGACYNASTCTLSLAIHPLGATAADSAAITEVYGNNLFNRGNPDNPLRNWSYVFFPYCSGDVFAGGAEAGTGYEGRTQQGFYNVQAYLKRLIATFPAASKVLLTGVSAGGFGAAFNFDQVQEAFGPQTRAYLLDDSGPPLPPEYMSPCLQERWREAWALDDIMPDDTECPGCRDARGDVGVMGMVDYLARKYPDRRLGLVTSARDLVIREFFGFGLNDCVSLDPPLGLPVPATPVSAEDYEKGLRELADYADAQAAPLRAFVVPDSEMHTLLLSPQAFGETESEGVLLSDWVRMLVEDDPAWGHVGL